MNVELNVDGAVVDHEGEFLGLFRGDIATEFYDVALFGRIVADKGHFDASGAGSFESVVDRTVGEGDRIAVGIERTLLFELECDIAVRRQHYVEEVGVAAV